MTLDDMIRLSAQYSGIEGDMFVDADSKNGAYLISKDATIYKNTLIGYINDSIRKTAREKKVCVTKEETSSGGLLLLPCITILSVMDSKKRSLSFEIDEYGGVDAPTDDVITVKYAYKPDDLVNLTDDYPLPENWVDYTLHCHFAAFCFLDKQNDDISIRRASTQLELYKDLYNSIVDNIGEPFEQKEVW